MMFTCWLASLSLMGTILAGLSGLGAEAGSVAVSLSVMGASMISVDAAAGAAGTGARSLLNTGWSRGCV